MDRVAQNVDELLTVGLPARVELITQDCLRLCKPFGHVLANLVG